MRPEQAEGRARRTGSVYVLRPFLGGRAVVPFRPNVATRLLIRLDRQYQFPDPAVRAFLAEVGQDDGEAVTWCAAAWSGEFIPRQSDTWRRVFTALRAAGSWGATSAELQEATGLGHGAVSAALSMWDRAGAAYRLRAP